MNNSVEMAQRLSSLWIEMAGKMVNASMSSQPLEPPPEAARAMRSGVFKAMSEAAEEFMRSADFMEMSRQALDGMINFRQQINNALTNFHHNFQGVAMEDVDNLMMSVQHMETRVLDRLERILDRLDAIERRMDAVESGSETEQRAAEERAAEPPAAEPPPAGPAPRRASQRSGPGRGKAGNGSSRSPRPHNASSGDSGASAGEE